MIETTGIAAGMVIFFGLIQMGVFIAMFVISIVTLCRVNKIRDNLNQEMQYLRTMIQYSNQKNRSTTQETHYPGVETSAPNRI